VNLTKPASGGTGLDLKSVIATVLGNAIEFYDFVSYATFAAQIGRAFFPTGTAAEGLLLSLATFGAGFLTRPLGGVVIGAFADRKGRRPAMTLTIVLMALGTGMIAIVPSYTEIGIAAPILLVLARLIQGFAVGGEVGPATAYLLEAAPPSRRAEFGSWQSASQGIATLTAGILGYTLTQTLGADSLDSWGWRVPFALGLLVLPIGLYIRRNLEETLDHGRVQATSMGVVHHTATQHYLPILLGVLAIMGATVATYINGYMTTYAQTTLKMAVGKSMQATVVVGSVGILAAVSGGILADRWSRRWVMIAPRVVLAIVAWPAFLYVSAVRDVTALLLVTGLFTFLNSFCSGVTIMQVTDSFPQWVRSTALGVTYAISVSVFGGSTQFFVAWLIDLTGDPVSPAYLLMAVSLPSALAAYYMRTATEA
jgi:MFS family permease